MNQKYYWRSLTSIKNLIVSDFKFRSLKMKIHGTRMRFVYSQTCCFWKGLEPQFWLLIRTFWSHAMVLRHRIPLNRPFLLLLLEEKHWNNLNGKATTLFFLRPQISTRSIILLRFTIEWQQHNILLKPTNIYWKGLLKSHINILVNIKHNYNVFRVETSKFRPRTKENGNRNNKNIHVQRRRQ